MILLYFIGFVLTAFWAYRFYNVSLIKQLYTVKHTSAGREFQLPSPRNSNQINPLVNPASDSLPLKSDAEKVSKLWEKIDYVRWKRLRANILSWQQIDKADIKNILSSLVNRKKLSLNTRQICSRVFCSCFHNDKQSRYHKLFDHGQRRLYNKELDVYKIVQASRRNRLLSRTLLNQRQQLLLKYQKYEMLDTEESSSATDQEFKKLRSSNPYLKLMALSKAKSVLSKYLLQDIDGCDTKLLSGFYQRRVISHEEQDDKQPQILERIQNAKQVAQ